MRNLLILFLILFPVMLQAQLLEHGNEAGTISIGVRSSLSSFDNGGSNNTSVGAGGQFRIRLAERVNTDWFLDYSTGDLGDFAHREDLHIGWSVLFYLLKPSSAAALFQPYMLAGHCFDHTRQTAIVDPSNRAERWSSAVQAGLGSHINVTDRSDISIVGQYMIHLGTDLHADAHDGEVAFVKSPGADLEGHLLLHISYNYKLFDAW